jgi:HipA-like protein
VASPALEVYLHGRLAGVLLHMDNGNLQFRYDKAYVEANGPPLSLNLPLRTEAFPHRDCLAFFGNLPRDALRGEARRDPDSVAPTSPGRRRGGRGAPLAGRCAEQAARGRGGRGFALPHGSGHPTTHILKPEPARFPGLVGNEFFCMRLAEEVGLRVAPVERAVTTSGLPFLIVSRYDRDLTQEPIRRLHQEDFCQALGRLYVEKYQQEGGPSVREAMKLIDDKSNAPARDSQQFWLALVFNVPIGNCHAHGKTTHSSMTRRHRAWPPLRPALHRRV